MNPIPDLSGPISAIAASWLATYALHSTILLALAAVVTTWLRRDAWRETMWRTALLGAFFTASVQAVVGFAPVVDRWTIGQASMTPSPVASATAVEPLEFEGSPPPEPATRNGVTPPDGSTQSAETTGRVAPEALAPPAEPPAGGSQGQIQARLIRFALVAWVLSAAVLLARVGRRQVQLFRALRGRRSIREGPLAEMVADLRRSAGVRKPVRLSASSICPTPIALGLFEISVPERFLTDLDPDQQRVALAHELAHLVRRDPVWDLFAGILEALFFFQPLNRIARHRLRETAENLSDDWAVRQTGSSLGLASCLTDIASWISVEHERLPASITAMAEGGSALLRRVRRLAERNETEPRPSRFRFAAAAGLLAATATGAPAISLGAPEAVAGPDVEEILDPTDPIMLATPERSPEEHEGTPPPDSVTPPETVIVPRNPSDLLAVRGRFPADRMGGQQASANPQPRMLTAADQTQEEAIGITYALSLGYGPGAVPGLSSTFAGDVAFAAGRGRIDVIEGAVDRATLRTDREPRQRDQLAEAGDYYLFDSSGFILVRPAMRTFSSHVFTELRPDTLPWALFGQVAPDDVVLTQHAPVDVYWHAANAGGQIVRGHLGIRDTPLTELIVLASFGATPALASISEAQGTVPSEIVTITAAAHFDAPGGPGLTTALRPGPEPLIFVDGFRERRGTGGAEPLIYVDGIRVSRGRGGDDARLNVITRHMMWGLEIAEVDLSRLVLPDGFTETAWPGFEGSADLPPLSADGGARWRTLPL